MDSFASEPTEISCSADTIFAFLSDLRNLESLMPEDVHEWSAEKERCSFKIKQLATIELFLESAVEHTQLVFKSTENSSLQFTIIWNLTSQSQTSTTVSNTLHASLNFFLKQAFSGYLKRFVHLQNEFLKNHLEQANPSN